MQRFKVLGVFSDCTLEAGTKTDLDKKVCAIDIIERHTSFKRLGKGS